MRILLEDFDEKHIRLLKEMATVLKFKVNKLQNVSTQGVDNDLKAESEETEMTLFAMQASEQAMAEAWEKDDDNYWNSYL